MGSDPLRDFRTPDRRTASKNIESIIRLEKEERLSPFHRFFHAVGSFVGTIYFVIVQCIVVFVWILANLRIIGGANSFDPFPFPLLSAFLALEAVLLTSVVLIRQNAMDLRSERRNHLDLQINLLAEQEATSLLNALQKIADRLQVDLSDDDGVKELAEDTQIERIAWDLRSEEEKNEQ